MLREYGPDDLDLQFRLLGDAETMAHLGGPETSEQIVRRHDRYLRMIDPDDGGMFVIEAADGSAAGSIGYWTRWWADAEIWEAGWFVLHEHRGKGMATAALEEVFGLLRARPAPKPLHAFPSVDNDASNAVCAKAGLRLVGAVDFEYPKGHPMRCNDWWVDLRRDGPVRSAG